MHSKALWHLVADNVHLGAETTVLTAHFWAQELLDIYQIWVWVEP